MSYGDLNVEAGDSKYIRIKPGQSVDIHILTKSEDVKTGFIHYDGKKYYDCLGKNCEWCANDVKRSQQFSLDVIDRADGKKKAFEFGPNIAIGIREIAKALELDGESIHNIDLRISRVSENPVRYTVVQRKKAKGEDDEPIPF